ncbi:unnamed protein product [Phaeothamnion confervicola]
MLTAENLFRLPAAPLSKTPILPYYPYFLSAVEGGTAILDEVGQTPSVDSAARLNAALCEAAWLSPPTAASLEAARARSRKRPRLPPAAALAEVSESQSLVPPRARNGSNGKGSPPRGRHQQRRQEKEDEEDEEEDGGEGDPEWERADDSFHDASDEEYKHAGSDSDSDYSDMEPRGAAGRAAASFDARSESVPSIPAGASPLLEHAATTFGLSSEGDEASEDDAAIRRRSAVGLSATTTAAAAAVHVPDSATTRHARFTVADAVGGDGGEREALLPRPADDHLDAAAAAAAAAAGGGARDAAERSAGDAAAPSLPPAQPGTQERFGQRLMESLGRVGLRVSGDSTGSAAAAAGFAAGRDQDRDAAVSYGTFSADGSAEPCIDIEVGGATLPELLARQRAEEDRKRQRRRRRRRIVTGVVVAGLVLIFVIVFVVIAVF